MGKILKFLCLEPNGRKWLCFESVDEGETSGELTEVPRDRSDEARNALSDAGLGSTCLILSCFLTCSNNSTGRGSSIGRSLHAKEHNPNDFLPSAPPYVDPGPSTSASSGASFSRDDGEDDNICCVCKTAKNNMAFNPCGHQTCCTCGELLEACPLCRGKLNEKSKLKLY